MDGWPWPAACPKSAAISTRRERGARVYTFGQVNSNSEEHFGLVLYESVVTGAINKIRVELNQ